MLRQISNAGGAGRNGEKRGDRYDRPEGEHGQPLPKGVGSRLAVVAVLGGAAVVVGGCRWQCPSRPIRLGLLSPPQAASSLPCR